MQVRRAGVVLIQATRAPLVAEYPPDSGAALEKELVRAG
jgi:hypothetical protein